MKAKSHKHPYKKVSEFRKDIISGEWILIVAGRRDRPGAKEERGAGAKRKITPKGRCPFEMLHTSESEQPVLWYPYSHMAASEDIGNWFLQVLPNKYPALAPHHVCPADEPVGPYRIREGIGFHEVVITRDHRRTIADMTKEEVEVILHAYQERYTSIENEPCIRYILVFHNHGESAGASISHPHSQIIALPIIPPDVRRSLSGSKQYFEKHGVCGHCDALTFEKKDKTRIIYENKKFIVLAPFASRVSFEVRIFPKTHEAHFERIAKSERGELADALRVALQKVKGALYDPDYNFFIHTAPAKTDGMDHYHWHIEILPRIARWAGVELGTGIQVVAIPPEEAAERLRKVKISH
ncbi:MAG: HIT domain-containing protein [bacterium]|nr:HIT domain-containing protein [bacterium]